jgi:hypothetical protein
MTLFIVGGEFLAIKIRECSSSIIKLSMKFGSLQYFFYSLTLFVPTPAVNQRADQLAGNAVENDIEWFDFLDFISLSRVRRLQGGWQSGWNGSDLRRYDHCIWRVV